MNVLVVDAGGTNVKILATGQTEPWSIVLTHTDAYWTNLGDGKVMKVPLGGGVATPVATVLLTGAWGLALDATSIYWSDPPNGTIYRTSR